MKFTNQPALFEHYQKRYNYFKQYQLKNEFLPETRICIVIPCFNEPNLIGTLQSLLKADKSNSTIEVIVVINSSTETTAEIRAQNESSRIEFEQFTESKASINLRFHLILATDLPPKKAGVGLARKIGMDEAFRQFAKQNKIGHFICLDADCRVSTNYLIEAEEQLSPEVRGGHFQFEHKLEEVQDEVLFQGIIQYELHLRYHNQGLKFTGFPYAEHTIGSCMIVRSDVYALLGGMNQRKAGEDFYFMNKIYPGGNCIVIKDAFVYPSARISDRVPFGTGRAQGQWIEQKSRDLKTYNPRIYSVIKSFLEIVLNAENLEIEALPDSLQEYLSKANFIHHHRKIRLRSKDQETFKKNFFLWCDAFIVLKMIHFLRDNFFPSQSVSEAAKLGLSLFDEEYNSKNPESLLQIYRQLERL